MFLHTDVGKDRLHDRQPSGINALAHFTIDLGLHRIDQVWRLRVDRNGEVPARRRGLAQTARFDRTGSAILNAGMIHIIGSIAVDLVVRMTGQFFSLRAEINLLAGVKRKIRSVERTLASRLCAACRGCHPGSVLDPQSAGHVCGSGCRGCRRRSFHPGTHSDC